MNKKTFAERCYSFLKKVPRGKVTTYKEIALALNTKAYRAVGNALRKNPLPGSEKGKIPCHRVIKTNGDVGDFYLGRKKKIEILKKEGIEIRNGKINLKKFIYSFKK
ncbi:MAG: hypothetical protein KatS3mg001_336 [Candidatus Pacearchaeota archaeon]|nr:MAG: hypothetical protein KatS3mg001_336 [Candidatus Pacearchaeota archaeon]